MSQMRRLSLLALLVLAWAAGMSGPPASAFSRYQDATPTPAPLTPAQLIALINRVRTGRGLRALIVDPILMGTAQSTADIMSGYSMTSHIGDVRGRVIAAGYGAGDIAWATENFAVLPPDATASDILSIWSDDLHMKPMADPNYKHIGAGVAVTGEDAVYYVVHAAYTSNGIYKANQTPAPGAQAAFSMSQYIFAVQTATPKADGSLVHVVKQGQSLWSIAIAYQTHIEILQRMNGMARENLTIYTGQKLRIPTAEKAAPIKEVAAETATAIRARMGTAEQAATATPEPSVTATPVPASPTPAPSIPETGDTVSRTILTVLVALGLVGVASIVFGLVIKR